MSGQTKGICKYCGAEYTKGGMQRHLRSCKERKLVLEETASGSGGYYGIAVEGKYQPEYWVVIEMPETAKLDDLDQFLRDIWCECCGHLSAFDINGISYEQNSMESRAWGIPARSSRIALGKVLREGMSFRYEYDFGNTTEISLKVLWYRKDGTAKGKKKKDTVTILSRNNPIETECGCCGKEKAVWYYLDNLFEGEDPFLCEACSQNEDVDEDMLYPVCNSPRMGVCGYEGSEMYPDQFVPDAPVKHTVDRKKDKIIKITDKKTKKKSADDALDQSKVGRSAVYSGPTLSPEDGQLFYQLWFPLLDYVNEKEKVNPAVGRMTGAKSLNPEEVKKVADYMWKHTEVIDAYLKGHAELPEEHRQIIASWKRCYSGRFVLERHLKKGSILIDTEKEQVFRSVGITTSWEEMYFYQKPPVLLDATLIPFLDVIIPDGLTMAYPLLMGGGVKETLRSTYMEAKGSGKIITQL